MIASSEIEHVRACIKKYGKKAIPYKKLSGCTQQLCKGLYIFNKNNPQNMFDILCIQEGTKEYTELIFKTINNNNQKKYKLHTSKISDKNILWTMYKKIFGNPIEIYKGTFKNFKNRPIQILIRQLFSRFILGI